jgi:invasion protein IalB
MSSLRLFFLVLMLAGVLGAGGIIAQQQPDSPGSARKAMPSSASPRLAAQSTTATPSQQLPNGASSISETYGDWTVNCRLVDGQKQCLLLHAQGNSQTGQRVFAIELRTPKDGKTEGTILMPFGLKLDSGGLLKLDDKDLGQGLRFSTCMPQGCLLPVSFPTLAVDAMKKAKMLTVASLNLSSGEVVTFNVPFEGFAAAIARIAELGR